MTEREFGGFSSNLDVNSVGMAHKSGANAALLTR